MPHTRRSFLVSATGAAGSALVLPFAALADAHMSNVFEIDGGSVTVTPVHHASVVLQTPAGTIYVDPVGDPAEYADLPRPDLILVTHEHGDHYNADTLAALMGEGVHLITNPAVSEKLPEGLSASEVMANGDETEWQGVGISAIPAYNITADRLNFHPEGRDNGYVITLPSGFRIYASGDTEDIPQMRALENIDIAFVCMNLPFTMTAEQAASAVREFTPRVVYPYHYRGRDGGTQDPAKFAELVGDASEVKMAGWYKPGELG